MQTKAFQAVLIAGLSAGAMSGCASYSLGSVRTTYSDPRLEVSCMALANDPAEINGTLHQLYEEGWRIAASGTKGGMGSQPFVCFERPEVAKPPPKAKAAKPPPPPVEEEGAVEEEAPPAHAAPPPAVKKGAAKKAPVVEEAEEPAPETPKPPKKRKPVLDE